MIGSHTNPNDYVFPRSQSRSTAEKEWESRLASPALGWGIEVLRLIGIALAGCGLLVVLLAVQ